MLPYALAKMIRNKFYYKTGKSTILCSRMKIRTERQRVLFRIQFVLCESQASFEKSKNDLDPGQAKGLVRFTGPGLTRGQWPGANALKILETKKWKQHFSRNLKSRINVFLNYATVE